MDGVPYKIHDACILQYDW